MDKITYAYLETTNYCNLDCSFCNRDEVIGPLKHMSLEDWGKLLDGIKHHPIQEANLWVWVNQCYTHNLMKCVGCLKKHFQM